MQKEQRLKEIKKEFIKFGLINVIPYLMLILGIATKFSKNDLLMFEVLQNETVVNSMIVVCVPIVIFCQFKVMKLKSEQNKLNE